MTRLVTTLTILAAFAALAGDPAVSSATEPDEPVVADLDALRLGTQVAGPRLTRPDLDGRVVLLYHWCVSCPLSTGGFPYVNQLVAKYRDRGLLVVGIQVRRRPEVAENDVVWYLEHLRPEFPVFRLGWDREWPSRYLPWGVLFDHEGNEVFANNLPEVEAAIEKALHRAPDHMIGGPYVRLKGLADEIVTDREHIGVHLTEARRIASGADEARAEAETLLAHVTRYFERQVARAEDLMRSPIEKEEAYAALATAFDGDPLGKRARERRDALRSAPAFAAEAAAEMSLRRARTTFRRLPPPGGYIYHFTDMNYQNSDDPVLIETRVRMIAEFRIALDRIVSDLPATHAAGVAADLLFEHDVPEITKGMARERVERAEKLLDADRAPGSLHEAHLLLYEVQEGYLATDEIAEKADRLLTTLRRDRADDLRIVANVLLDLGEKARVVQAEIQAAGSLLPRDRANERIERLRTLAKNAGSESLLARRITTYVEKLAQSYEGPVSVGVSLDRRFRGPGARIARVHGKTSAAKAGLVAGDVVLSIDGTTLESLKAFGPALADRKPGQTVKAEVRHASGEVETMEILLGRKM